MRLARIRDHLLRVPTNMAAHVQKVVRQQVAKLPEGLLTPSAVRRAHIIKHAVTRVIQGKTSTRQALIRMGKPVRERLPKLVPTARLRPSPSAEPTTRRLHPVIARWRQVPTIAVVHAVERTCHARLSPTTAGQRLRVAETPGTQQYVRVLRHLGLRPITVPVLDGSGKCLPTRRAGMR